jgi:hypothetical protein
MEFTELIYRSTMVGYSEHELKPILESAVKHNQLNGITGMLLYFKGAFMQVLEGREREVMTTYARICADTRHQRTSILSIRGVEHRIFGQWSMGFKHVNPSEIAQFPQLEQIYNLTTEASATKVEVRLALEMLSLFNTGMIWRVAA